ncbi:hypothetical protein GPK34_02165 [Secundilactobacillus kimchicus]|nr:hypothetical protein [Secundilactobacillus kimchicus]MBT9670843.1 hypothetical protein [Secundilactobacillus kimchicus]
MSTDVRLDINGDPNFMKGDSVVNGIDELRQSLRLRLMSSVGWAKDDDSFGVEWLNFFGTTEDTDIAAAKIAEAYENDDRVSQVLDVNVTPNLDRRRVSIQVKLRLSDSDLIADNNGNPNIELEQPLGF